MSVTESLQHPLETFRTAPAQFTAIAAGLGVAALASAAGRKANGRLAAAEYTVAGLTIVGATLNGFMANKQFKQKNRFERFLGKYGCDETYFGKTTG